MMQPRLPALIKVLINKYDPDGGERLLKSFPQDLSKEIREQPIASSDFSAALLPPPDILERIHYSWLAPTFERLPLWQRSATLSILPRHQAEGLKKMLKLPLGESHFSPFFKEFLLSQFLHKWQPYLEVLPLPYLPFSPLSVLLSLKKKQLVEIIDFFSMHDLAEAIRHIVDKKNLKAIFSCLSARRQEFLRHCLHQKEKMIAPNLEIEKWNGDPKKLERTLHQRGLLRFGKALCGQHPQFVWYLTHTLDTGRGAVLSHYYQEEPIPGVTSILVQQVLFINNFIQKRS